MLSVMVLSGSVVRVWGALESVLKRHEGLIKKSDSVLKIVRVPLNNEGHLIGVR